MYGASSTLDSPLASVKVPTHLKKHTSHAKQIYPKNLTKKQSVQHSVSTENNTHTVPLTEYVPSMFS